MATRVRPSRRFAERGERQSIDAAAHRKAAASRDRSVASGLSLKAHPYPRLKLRRAAERRPRRPARNASEVVGLRLHAPAAGPLHELDPDRGAVDVERLAAAGQHMAVDEQCLTPIVAVSSKIPAIASSRALGLASTRNWVIIRPFLPNAGAWTTSRTPACARRWSTA